MNLEAAFSLEKLSYIPNFLSLTFSEHLYQALTTDIKWEQPELVLFGKKCRTPRLVGFAGDEGVSYQYSGYRHVAQSWPSELLIVKDQIQNYLNEPFNSALCNHYRDGRDYMGWHSDDEAALGEHPCVASLSIGAERDLKIRNKSSRESQQVSLENGSLMVMHRGFQEEWQHSLPKRLRSKHPRINVTFRNILGV